MNVLTVLSLAAVAACGSAQLFGYPGVYGGYPGLYPGLLPHGYGYSGLFPGAPPVTLKTAAHTPVAYNVAPFAPFHSKYHAQDQLGQYSFGYADGPSSRAETRDAFGTVRGSYNYVDSEGKIQTQHYIADTLGFRVSGTNLPVAPDAPVAAPLALPGPVPEPVEDTPEVAVAKAAHQVAYDAAAAGAPLALPGPVPVAVEDTPEVVAAKAVHKVAFDEAAAAAAAAPDSRK